MARWIIGGIAVLLVVVLFLLWRRPVRQSEPAEDRVATTRNIPKAATEEKPAAEIRKRPIAPVVSNPTAPSQDKEMDSQDEQMKKMVELARPQKGGPLEILKRVYEDDSRDATASDIEKLIRDQFGDEYLPTEYLHSVTCHERACKIQMYWTEKNPLVLMAFAMKTGQLLTGYIASDPEPEPDQKGRTLVTLYILREGDILDL
jgi:hypothetical protein